MKSSDHRPVVGFFSITLRRIDSKKILDIESDIRARIRSKTQEYIDESQIEWVQESFCKSRHQAIELMKQYPSIRQMYS
jgi:hypothetical protein